ncbi:MAG TPA: hypothetical protein V6D22_09645 [Candidatus Obscuribacterales bacterium]
MSGTDANDNLKNDKPSPADSQKTGALINRLRDEQITNQQPNRSWLNQAVHSAVGTFVHNESATRNQSEKYAVEFIKAVPLFVGGVWGKALSTVAFGADEVKCNDSGSMQALELVTGAGKGFLTKTAFDYIGARDLNFAVKGMAMGSGSRLIDTALTPGNYFGANGNVDFSRGVEKAAVNAGDAKALGVDVLTFGAAHLVPGAFARTALQRSTALTTSLTGASFGFASGSLGELQRQWHDGKITDWGGILKSGGIEAGLMAAAAATGHTLTQGMRPIEERRTAGATASGEAEERRTPAATKAEKAEPKAEPKAEATAKPDRFGYTGFFLDDAAMNKVRGSLQINGAEVAPKWTAPDQLHITEKFGVRESAGLPANKSVKVVGHALDEKGIEALVVSVDGQTTRADKRPYHLTRSLGEGRKANESMATVEKAIAIDKARTEGDLSKFSAEDIARYRYTALRPEEQFELSVQPKFEPTAETKAKEKPKKVEVAFEDMPPRQQAATALKSTPRDYLDKNISTRTPENRMGSYWEMTADELKRAIHTADWKPFEDKDGVIAAPARAYQSTIPGGRLGMTTLESVPQDAKLYLVDPKGTGKWSLATSGAMEPVTDKATLIVGPGDDGKMISWTFHPGDPVRPSNLDSAKLQSILGDMGISADTTRIKITRAQLDKINSQLPPDQQMTMVKLESPANELSDRTNLATSGIENKSDAEQFQKLVSALPEGMRERFVGDLEGVLKRNGDVIRATRIRGINFEMSRMQRTLSQGLETISDQQTTAGKVKYHGYNKADTEFIADPHEVKSSNIQLDVPLIRENGKPYVYEVKTSPRMLFGSAADQRNQILKYQAAIDQGTIDGASIEVTGRVNPELLTWLNGKAVGDPAAAPDVELLYSMPLPSGADYTFVLKRAENNRGLRFFNDDKTYTPEDKKIITGVYKAIQDRSIGNIISGTHVDDPRLQEQVGDPMSIDSADLFYRYDQARLQSIWGQLTAKATSDRINSENPRNATSDYNNRDYIEEATRWYQDHLRQNPDSSKAKQAYLLKSDESVNGVVNRAYDRAQVVRAYETNRTNSTEEAQRRAERARLGYTGRPEGVSLDIEHFIMDATQEENKSATRRGRSYDNPERFMKADQLTDYLNSQDRRTINIKVFDPVSKTEKVQSNAPEKEVEKTRRAVDVENINRAGQAIDNNETRYGELRSIPKEQRTPEQNAELRSLISRHAGFAMNKPGIEKLQQQIQSLTSERIESARALNKSLQGLSGEEKAARIEAIRQQGTKYDRSIDAARTGLRNIYKQALGGQAEWEKLEKTVNVEDNNMIKFMYVVTPEGTIPLSEEVIRGESSGRASHSELAGGRNVYGAGELVFKKDAATGKWVLTEINNASGHYRPPGDGTLEYVRNLVQNAGIDTSQTDLFDALQRGTRLRDQHLFAPGYVDDKDAETKPAA